MFRSLGDVGISGLRFRSLGLRGLPRPNTLISGFGGGGTWERIISRRFGPKPYALKPKQWLHVRSKKYRELACLIHQTLDHLETDQPQVLLGLFGLEGMGFRFGALNPQS